MNEAKGMAERKSEHLRMAVSPDSEAVAGAGWADVSLVHQALPVTDLDAVDLSTSFLGRRLAAPVAIAGMTGGLESGGQLNALLARAAQRHGLAIGFGSQRAAVRRPELEPIFRAAREAAPEAFLIANVGAAQLLPQEASPALG